jgi:hypothetical protein
VGEVEGEKAATSEAQHVRFSAEKDCKSPAYTVGKIERGKEAESSWPHTEKADTESTSNCCLMAIAKISPAVSERALHCQADFGGIDTACCLNEPYRSLRIRITTLSALG